MSHVVSQSLQHKKIQDDVQGKSEQNTPLRGNLRGRPYESQIQALAPHSGGLTPVVEGPGELSHSLPDPENASANPEPAAQLGSSQASEAPAEEAQGGPSTTNVKATPSIPEVAYVRNLSATDIAMVSTSGTTLSNAGLAKAGKGDPKVTYEHAVDCSAREDGNYDYAVTHVNIVPSFSSLTIYIASDYANNPAQVSIIESHEMEHIDVMKTVLTDYASKMVQSVQDAGLPDTTQPWVVASEAEGDQKLATLMVSRLKFLSMAMNSQMVLDNQALDSAEHYQEVFDDLEAAE